MCFCAAVEAVLRGDESPTRVDSISVNLKNHVPPLSGPPRPHIPPIPQHTPSSSASSSPSSTINGRHNSPSTYPRSQSRPLPPVVRTASSSSREKEAAPPLPNRVTSPGSKDSAPPPLPPNRASSPGRSRDGPPLPNRGSLRGTHPSSARGPPHRQERTEMRTPPLPPSKDSSRPGVGGGGGGRGNPPPPPRPGTRPQPPDRPKPALPNRPTISPTPKKPSFSTGSGGGGGGRSKGGASPVSIPAPDQLTARQMIDFILKESPSIVSNIKDKVGNIPRLLDDFVTLGEAIAENATGTTFQFRRRMTELRTGLGTLKTYSNVSWHYSITQIVEELEKLVSVLEVISRNLAE